MAKHIYISTGEPSGENHAAGVVHHLRELIPAGKITGMGGHILAQEGVEIITTAPAVIGFAEVARHLGDIHRLTGKCLNHIITTRPDVVLLVDYPGFHLRLARKIKKACPEQKILYYISPKFWAWNYRRVRQLREYIDEVICILPFEPPLLEKEGVKARFVGNPLLDQLDLDEDGNRIRADLDIPAEKKLIGILPGSRRSELIRHLPAMIAAAGELNKKYDDLAYVIALPPGMTEKTRDIIDNIDTTGIPMVTGRSHEVMAASCLLLAKSGTTTLEAALFGTPMVAIYRTSHLSYIIARLMVRLKHFTLPNILAYDYAPAGRKAENIITELAQHEVTGTRIAQEAGKLLDNDTLSQHISQHLRSLIDDLGGRGASRRCAEAVKEYLFS